MAQLGARLCDVKKSLNVALVLATLGGLVGLGASATLISERGLVAEIPVSIPQPQVKSLFIEELRDQIALFEISPEGQEERFGLSVESGGSFQLRDRLGSESALLALGEELWAHATMAAVDRAEDRLSDIHAASQEFCPSGRCQIETGLGELEGLGAIAKASKYIPQWSADAVSFGSLGNGPSSPVVLAAGTGIGATLGGLTGWFSASLFRRNRG